MKTKGKEIKKRNVVIFVSVIVIILLILSIKECGITSLGQKRQIKTNIYNSLSIYPTKNLEKFYDIKGAKNSHFKENDKGMWIFNSSMQTLRKGFLKSECAVLYLDRNDRNADGYYYIENFKNNKLKSKKKYPFKLKNNKLVPSEKVNDSKIENKIKKFKFFVQYSDINANIDNKKGKYRYNYNLPDFQGIFNLNEKDNIIKKLKQIYKIPYNKAEMNISGGNPKNRELGEKDIEITFKENEVYFQDSINFNPVKEKHK